MFLALTQNYNEVKLTLFLTLCLCGKALLCAFINICMCWQLLALSVRP